MTDDETARQIIDIAWAEFTKSVDGPHMPIHPQMRALMVSLVTTGIKVERKACKKIAKDAAAKDARHSDGFDITGLTSEGMRAWEIYRNILAREEKTNP